jgi:hypothetical protein
MSDLRSPFGLSLVKSVICVHFANSSAQLPLAIKRARAVRANFVRKCASLFNFVAQAVIVACEAYTVVRSVVIRVT